MSMFSETLTDKTRQELIDLHHEFSQRTDRPAEMESEKSELDDFGLTQNDDYTKVGPGLLTILKVNSPFWPIILTFAQCKGMFYCYYKPGLSDLYTLPAGVFGVDMFALNDKDVFNQFRTANFDYGEAFKNIISISGDEIPVYELGHGIGVEIHLKKATAGVSGIDIFIRDDNETILVGAEGMGVAFPKSFNAKHIDGALYLPTWDL